MSAALSRGMTKWLFGVFSLGACLVVAAACSSDKNNQAPCAVGSLGCFCYGNGTCDRGLACIAKAGVCTFDIGAGGAFDGPSVGDLGGAADVGDDGGSPSEPDGGKATSGGSSGTSGTNNQGGSFNFGGTTALGGSAGSVATAGSSSTSSFPDNPAGCALVASCPSCCETVGVYALDPLANDATQRYVKAFNVTASAATAEYDLTTTDEIGAIFFRFKSPQSIGSLSVAGLGTGGSLEIALVRAGGLDGCIYPIVGSSLSPVPETCWGLGAGPYAALPADQIEVRVRSLLGGRAALNVTRLDYGP